MLLEFKQGLLDKMSNYNDIYVKCQDDQKQINIEIDNMKKQYSIETQMLIKNENSINLLEDKLSLMNRILMAKLEDNQ